MLIDSVKGVEPQTIKLFEVCRLRRIPIVTFINKMDRLGREPLELLDEIERVLQIPTSPVNWPIGAGPSFQGIYDRWSQKLWRFEREAGGTQRATTELTSLDDPLWTEIIGTRAREQLAEELALLDAAGNEFQKERFRSGDITPVFFGSAVSNFGVETFLDQFVGLAPSPRARPTTEGSVEAVTPHFSAFVFKIQANMDPQHRDRVAFARVCSGRFARGMEVRHVRTGKTLTLNRTLHFLGQERTLLEEAHAGDIIGIWDPGILRIGDTLSERGTWEFENIPRFSPEHFVRVRLTDPLKRKQLKKGLEQLSEEGAVQLFFDRMRLERDPILGAIGALQFEVTQHRLKSEYGVSVEFDRLPYQIARWVEPEPDAPFDPARFERSGRSTCVVDIEGRPLVLFDTNWALRMAQDDNPRLRFIAAMQPGRSARSAA
jgi:peptide chain release factor 3